MATLSRQEGTVNVIYSKQLYTIITNIIKRDNSTCIYNLNRYGTMNS